TVALSGGFISHYNETLKIGTGNENRIKQELNRFAIARTIYHPHTDIPYIPGSSVKGALRTAWLNALQQKKKLSQFPANKAKNLEETLLDGGKFDTDPFRLVKVSDFMPVGPVKTRVVYAVNEKKTRSKFAARGVYQILEIIEVSSLFEGTITVEKPLDRNAVRSPFTAQELLKSVSDFYRQELARENDELAAIDIKGIKIPVQTQGFPMRIGRHSGAESVTIEGQRRIRIMQGKGKPALDLDHATTLWLAASERRPKDRNLHPFGWVLLIPGPAPKSVDFPENAKPSADPSETQNTHEQQEVKTTQPKRILLEHWKDATLTWHPGKQTVTASWGGKKAEGKGENIVPSALHKNLCERRKPTKANLTVERVGNAYKIVSIEETQG
ncbi:MAG: type III-A CRISPR-associated RAMP protein Csm5, partial [Syntrophales bacterium]|nr:type III-A CRISPR-associated RAMP protein Csm5 [Syntrophales bacterium]